MIRLAFPLMNPCGILTLTLVALLSALPAHALDSGWAETDGGRMRIVIDPTARADGRIRGVLDIDLEKGWKTYWQDPGGSGIPPSLDLEGSRGIKLESIKFPPPVRVNDGYSIWAGYKHPVRLPLVFLRQDGGEATLKVTVFIGICEKVCIPFQASFSVDLPADNAEDPAAADLVETAFAMLPSEPASDFHLTGVEASADLTELEIGVVLPVFRPSGVKAELFIAGPPGWAFAPPQSLGEKDGVERFRIRIEGRTKDHAANGGAARLDTVVTLGARAIGGPLELR